MKKLTQTLAWALAATLLLTGATTLRAAEKAPAVPSWTDPGKAAAEHPDFLIQGEYEGEVDGKKTGLQASDINEGKFLVAIYQGGLPGAGWDKSKIQSSILSRDELKAKLAGFKRVERVSETMGLKAPEGARVIFAGQENPHIKGEIKDGYLWAGGNTTEPVGAFTLHLEYRLPFKPGRMPSSQDRGNSGVYIYNSYECQVLDSFALDLVEENNPFKVESRNNQWCGSFYKFKTPDTHMVFPPLTWQTLDIEFTPAAFENGAKVKNARATVRHNGVVIHNDVELPKGTGAGGSKPEVAEGLIYLQGHGNPIAYRNFWILPK